MEAKWAFGKSELRNLSGHSSAASLLVHLCGCPIGTAGSSWRATRAATGPTSRRGSHGHIDYVVLIVDNRMVLINWWGSEWFDCVAPQVLAGPPQQRDRCARHAALQLPALEPQLLVRQARLQPGAQHRNGTLTDDTR